MAERLPFICGACQLDTGSMAKAADGQIAGRLCDLAKRYALQCSQFVLDRLASPP